MTFYNTLLSLILIFLTAKTFAQIPSISCPNYFQYLLENSRFIGKITLLNVASGLTRLEVHFSQQGIIPSPNPSRLSLYDSQQDTINNVLAGQPISYRVDFPFAHILPKLTYISVNGEVMCMDQDFPPPSSQLNLTHTLEMTRYTTLIPYGVRDTGFNMQPNNYFNSHIFKNRFETYNQRPGHQQHQQQDQYQHHQTFTTSNNVGNFYNPYFYNGFNNNKNNAVPQAAPSTTSTSTLPTDSTNLNEVCGREGVTITPLIRGGTVLKRGQFPWLTAIYYKRGSDSIFICGGSLLTTRTVISAAHCFKEQNIPANRILLMLGRLNLAEVGEDGNEYRTVENLILHPEYDAKSITDADIAILQMKNPVSFTNYIKPICLWNTADDVSYIVGYSAFVAGWGATERGDTVSLIAKQTSAEIEDEFTCEKSLQQFQILSSKRTICASQKNGGGPCTGDSGGALMIESQGRWLLRGIVSAGLTRYGHCAPYENFYFCDVAKHLNWVKGYMIG